MNWDAIGAVAEGLGAVAVIISIIYLAAQVRHTRRQLEAQAEDNISARSFEAYNPVYEGNNAHIFRKAGIRTSYIKSQLRQSFSQIWLGPLVL